MKCTGSNYPSVWPPFLRFHWGFKVSFTESCHTLPLTHLGSERTKSRSRGPRMPANWQTVKTYNAQTFWHRTIIVDCLSDAVLLSFLKIHGVIKLESKLVDLLFKFLLPKFKLTGNQTELYCNYFWHLEVLFYLYIQRSFFQALHAQITCKSEE